MTTLSPAVTDTEIPNFVPTPPAPRRSRRKLIGALLAAGALAVAIPGIGTLASFTSTDSNKANIGHCAKDSSMYKVQIKVDSDEDEVKLGVFSKKSK